MGRTATQKRPRHGNGSDRHHGQRGSHHSDLAPCVREALLDLENLDEETLETLRAEYIQLARLSRERWDQGAAPEPPEKGPCEGPQPGIGGGLHASGK